MALNPNIGEIQEGSMLNLVVKQLQESATQIQFSDNLTDTYAPPPGVLTQTVTACITDSTGAGVYSSKPGKTVKVTINAGVNTTAPGITLSSLDGKIKGGVGSSVVFPLVTGFSKIVVDVTGSGLVELGLASSSDMTLLTTDVANITFS